MMMIKKKFDFDFEMKKVTLYGLKNFVYFSLAAYAVDGDFQHSCLRQNKMVSNKFRSS